MLHDFRLVTVSSLDLSAHRLLKRASFAAGPLLLNGARIQRTIGPDEAASVQVDIHDQEGPNPWAHRVQTVAA